MRIPFQPGMHAPASELRIADSKMCTHHEWWLLPLAQLMEQFLRSFRNISHAFENMCLRTRAKLTFWLEIRGHRIELKQSYLRLSKIGCVFNCGYVSRRLRGAFSEVCEDLGRMFAKCEVCEVHAPKAAWCRAVKLTPHRPCYAMVEMHK